MECTIVIPTYNRPNHLARILGYYKQNGSDLPVIVADSSSVENKKQNQKTIYSFSNASFLYLDKYDPSINPYHKIFDALQQVSTKYCVLCADDDFVTPRGIQKAADFLERNPNYTAAYGNHATFQLELVSSTESKLRYRQYRSQSNTHLEPKNRLLYEVANNYNTSFYAVHHIDFMKMIFTEASKLTGDLPFAGTFMLTSELFFAELIIVWLPVIYGKMKCLDTLFCAREDCTPVHLSRTRVTFQDLVNEKIYKKKKQEFSDCVAGRLSKQSGIRLVEANIIVDNAIAMFGKKCDYPMNKISRLMTDLNLPTWLDQGIRKYYRTVAFFFSPTDGADSASSEYYNEYNQISFCIRSNAREVYGRKP